MQTGKQVHKKIVGSIADVTTKISNIDGQISATEREIERQNLIRERIITRLAEMFAENSGELSKKFYTINQRVQTIFNQKAARRKTIIAELEKLEKDINATRDDIAATDRLLGEKQDMVIDSKARIAGELRNNPEYVGLEGDIEKLRELVRKDDDRLAHLEADCHDKMNDYENDLYFSYLNRLNFGTPDYTPGWFPKLDRWLARVSHYNENVKKYNVLKVIPERVRAANDSRRATIASKIETRDALADKFEEAAGLKPLLAETKVLETRKESQTGTLKLILQTQTNLRREKTVLDSGDDKYQKEAKEALKSFFNSQSIQDIRRQAAKTDTEEDDQLVHELERAENEINAQRTNAKELIKARKPLEEQLTRIKDLEYRFTKDSYESSRSRFDDSLDVDGLLLSYAAGSIAESVFTQKLNQAHYTERQSTYAQSSYGSRDSHEDDSYRRTSYSTPSSYSAPSEPSRSSDSYSSGGSSSSSDSYSSGGFDSGSSSSSDSGGGCSSGGDF